MGNRLGVDRGWGGGGGGVRIFINVCVYIFV